MYIFSFISEKIKFQERPITDLIIGALYWDTWRSLNRCDLLLIKHYTDCVYLFKGKAYSPLFDSVGEVFEKHGFKVCSILKPLSRLTKDKVQFSPVLYNQSFLKIEIIRFLLKLMKGKTYSEIWAEKCHYQLWCRILEKSNPRIVIGAMPKKEICQAGKALKIPIYDLQHGVISDDHPWYGERFRSNSNPQNLPDGFLVWDESGVETLEKWVEKKGVEVIKIGNPWFSRFFMNDRNDLLVQEALSSVSMKVKDKPGILLTLQWGMKRFYPGLAFNGYIVPALEQVLLETINQYNWIIRLHQVQLRSSESIAVSHYLKSKFDNKMVQKWISWSETPLPVVLKQVDLHITDSSSVVIEAGWMGVKSCILNPEFLEGGIFDSYYRKEREAGLAHVIPQDPDAIKSWIEESMKNRAKSIKGIEMTNNLDFFICRVVSD